MRRARRKGSEEDLVSDWERRRDDAIGGDVSMASSGVMSGALWGDVLSLCLTK